MASSLPPYCSIFSATATDTTPAGRFRLNHLSELALLQQQAVRQGAAAYDIADIAQARLIRVPGRHRQA